MKYTLHQILIHTLSECDLKCTHCYARNFKERLSLDEIKRVLVDANKLGASLCHLSGGEFFLREDYREIVEYASGLFLYVEITSNGQRLNKETCLFLKGKISKLIISFEGPNAKINDKIRGKGSFVKAKKAVLTAKENEIKVGINFTITKQNVNIVENMIKFGESIKSDFINFRRFIPVGAGTKDMELSPKDYLKLNLIINKARKRNPSIAMAGDPTRILLDPTIKSKTNFAGCMAGIALISINPNGDVTPCGYLNYPGGNIRKESLIDIWNNSKILWKLRDRNNIKGNCKNCSNKMLCGGCRASAFAKHGDIFASDPLCWKNEKNKK